MKTNHIFLQTEMTISASVMEALKCQSHKFWTVHSIFDNGFNLQSQDQIIYIATFKQSLSAHGLLISDHSFYQIKKALRVGNRVQYKDIVLRFFTHPFIFDLNCDNKHVINLSIANISLTDKDYIYLKDSLEKIDFSNHVDQSLYQKVTTSHSRYIINRESNLKWIKEFIGMGHGLTPSGDDFIQGMLIIAFLRNDALFTQTVGDLITQKSTTDVAKAYYDSLFQEQINEQWHQLFKAVIDKNQAQLEIAINNIQSYGASSGSDMLFGAYYYLQQTFY